MATLESVLEQVQQLDKRDQVLLAEKLYEGIVETEEIREAWKQEVLRRSKAHKAGETSTVDVNEAIAEVRRLIRP